MPTQFAAQVFQNEYLPAGAGEVHAIMTVTAGAEVAASRPDQGRLFGIICDCSGSMEGQKMHAAREAMIRLIGMLPEDCGFFVIAGEEAAHLVAPLSLATADAKQRAIERVKRITAGGGTMISRWLPEAVKQFQMAPNGLHQAVLLTDGQNEPEDAAGFPIALQTCERQF